jgi:hypothetical protein
MLTFSNPRLSAKFDDWPSGSHRVKCTFEIVCDAKRGWRVIRTTTDKNGKWCKPKATTFGGRAVLVDGSDGRTYILQHAGNYDFIVIRRSDFMDEATIFPETPKEGYPTCAELMGIILKGAGL